MAEPHADGAVHSGTNAEQNLALAAKGKGMNLPNTGTDAIESEHGGVGANNHPDPRALGLDGTGWVSLAMAVFVVVLIVARVPRLIGGMLDGRIAAIRTRLDEAKQLRAEAEALRDEYARRIANVEAEAAAMVAHADDEARALIAQAEQDAAALVARRARMAEDRIAAAERAAVQAVRTRAADAATRAAAELIAGRHDAGADKALIDRTIAGLGAGSGRPN
jgi:F-type H+-transporting ATPase subunit b